MVSVFKTHSALALPILAVITVEPADFIVTILITLPVDFSPVVALIVNRVPTVATLGLELVQVTLLSYESFGTGKAANSNVSPT